MKLKRLFAKNFLSVGDSGVEYTFDFKDILLIHGKNGAGKSQCLDILTFNFYDKNFRGVNKTQLPNIHNPKHCYTESELEVDGDTYIIKRGISPNIFEVWKNGVEVPQQSSVKLMQDWLETHVLKDSYAVFKQKYILGSADYTPFMKLDAKQRREFSEQVLNLTVFTRMNKSLKEKLAVVNADLMAANASFLDVERGLASMVGMIQSDIEENTKKLQELLESGNKHVQHLKSLEEDRSKVVVNDYSGFIKEHNDVSMKMNNIKFSIDANQKLLEFFKHTTECPTCKQGVSDSHVKSMTENIERQVSLDHEEYDKLKFKADMLMDQINTEKAEETKISSFNRLIEETNYNIKTLKNSTMIVMQRIEELKARVNNGSEVEQLKHRRLELESKIKTLTDEKEVMGITAKLLKDDGIKASVMKQFIPVLNQNINKYLQVFDFFVKFEFDENFDETISGGAIKQYSYNSFSMGERQRIDLAMHLAWKDIAQTQSAGDLGVLFFDETLDSSLDYDGADVLLDILKNRLNGVKSVIISHKSEFKDKVEDHISVLKENGFTRLHRN